MSIPREIRGKFYALRALAAVLSAVGLGAFVLRPDSFDVRSLGFIAIFGALWLVRRSNENVRHARGQVVEKWSPTKEVRRVGPLAWTFTAASLVACGAFYFLMYLDELHGGKEAWPVYGLFGAVLALAMAGGYLAMKLLP